MADVTMDPCDCCGERTRLPFTDRHGYQTCTECHENGRCEWWPDGDGCQRRVQPKPRVSQGPTNLEEMAAIRSIMEAAR